VLREERRKRSEKERERESEGLTVAGELTVVRETS
jgi:hypothetical protein